MEIDYYKVLEIPSTATQEEIKKAFRRLSKLHHPDKGGDTEKFKQINEAYQTLSNEEKKFAYDNGTKYVPPPAPSVQDIVFQVPWKFDDVKNGRTLKFDYTKLEVCSDCLGIGSKDSSSITVCSNCKGTGHLDIQIQTPFGPMVQSMGCSTCNGRGKIFTNPCPTCKGEQMVSRRKTMEIKVPPKTLHEYVVEKGGHNTVHGTSNLKIHFILQEPNFIILRKDTLGGSLNVLALDALLGKEQIIQMGSTTLKVKIPKESQDEQQLRLPNAFCGYTVVIALRVFPLTLKDMETFMLSLIGEEKEISKVIENIKQTLKKD